MKSVCAVVAMTVGLACLTHAPAAVASPTTRGAATSAPATTSAPAPFNPLASMPSVCRFSPEQAAQFTQLIEAGQNELAEHDRANSGAIQTLMQMIELAELRGNKAAGEQAMRKFEEIKNARLRMVEDQQARARALLTAPQRRVWAEYETFGRVERMFRLAALSPDQLSQVRLDLHGRLEQIDPDDAGALAEATAQTVEQVRASVLTERQRSRLAGIMSGLPPMR